MKLRCWLKTLLTLALALPVAYGVLAWVRWITASMGDVSGATFIGHIGTACLAGWAISLVGLVIVVAAVQLIEQPPNEDTDE